MKQIIKCNSCLETIDTREVTTEEAATVYVNSEFVSETPFESEESCGHTKTSFLNILKGWMD